MKTLDRYIGTRFILGFLLVLSILVILFSFLELVAQLDDIGEGVYRLKDAFVYVGLTLPRRILDLLPVSMLLGGIITLGLLADSNELLAMQAAGLSVQRICWPVIATGALLMLASGVLAELVVPPLEIHARMRRSLALSEPGIMLTKQGFWARHGRSFIHVGKVLQGGLVADLDIFERDDQGRLHIFNHARQAKIHDNRRWLLTDIEQKIITDRGISVRPIASQPLDSFLSAEQVAILELPADSLSPSDLYQYVGALRESGKNADHYALALWQKLSIPFTTGAMVLLSLPFAFGLVRQMTTGKRIMLGAMVGIAFYLANQIIGHLGLLLGFHPALTTMAPVAAVIWVALWRLRRVR